MDELASFYSTTKKDIFVDKIFLWNLKTGKNSLCSHKKINWIKKLSINRIKIEIIISAYDYEQKMGDEKFGNNALLIAINKQAKINVEMNG